MASRQVTAAELKELDPRRFEQEYYDWANNCALWDEWAESIEEMFKQDVAPFGANVQSIQYDIGGGCPQAIFIGGIALDQFMEECKVEGVPLSELYPALYLAVCEDGSWVRVTSNYRRMGIHLDIREQVCVTDPMGIFSGLDGGTWEELVNDQWNACDLESHVRSFIDDKCGDLARDLQAEYEHLTSEEAFLESCEANEITFELESEDEPEFCS